MSSYPQLAACLFLALTILTPALGATLGTSDAQRLVPEADPPSDSFGFQIAYSDGSMIVGHPGYDYRRWIGGNFYHGTNYGAVHFYAQNEQGEWSLSQNLVKRSNGEELDNFGTSVAMDGNLAVVGAIGADDGAYGAGAAWLLERDERGRWQDVARFVSTSPSYRGAFSNSVAVSGRVVAVGAPREGSGGFVYLFSENEVGQWAQSAKIAPPTDETDVEFGTSVAMFGDTLVVGAKNANRPSPYSGGVGAAHVYRRDESDSWNLVASLEPGIPGAYDFGTSVSIWEDTLAVGATGGSIFFSGSTNAGSAYIFQKGADGDWTKVANLALTHDLLNANFGESVSVRDGAVLVGAPYKSFPNGDTRTLAGAAYLYRETDAHGWVQVAELTSLPDIWHADRLGISVALADGFALVSTPVKYDSSRRGHTGAVYAYPVPEPTSMLLFSAMLMLAWHRWRVSHSRDCAS